MRTPLTAPQARYIFLLLLAIFLSACGNRAKNSSVEPHVDRAVPARAFAGIGFNEQPDGGSGFTVHGQNFPPDSKVRWNGERLTTARIDASTLNATLAKSRFTEDGIYPVSVETPDGRVSNSVAFVVLPKGGTAPVIRELYPAKAEIGKPFNEQPGGRSAIGVVGQWFVMGAVVEINGEPQETAFRDSDQVTALIAPKLLSAPGTLKVTVRNKDGLVSAPADLVLTSPAVK